MEISNLRTPLRYAGIAFVVSFALSFAAFFVNRYTGKGSTAGDVIGWTCLVLGIVISTMAGIGCRRQRGGFISFSHAFFAIYFVAMVFAWTDVVPDMLLRLFGYDPSTGKSVAHVDWNVSHMIKTMAIVSIIFAITSLITAGILKKAKSEVILTRTPSRLD